MTEKELKEKTLDIISKIPDFDGVKAWNEWCIAFATGLEESAIGVTIDNWGEPYVVYDRMKAIEVLCSEDSMGESEADEFLCFNTWDLWTEGVWGAVITLDDMFDSIEETLSSDLDNDETLQLFSRYEKALIGIVDRKLSRIKAIYSFPKCVEIEMSISEIDEKQASDIVLKTFFSESCENTPVLMWPI